jgi:UDP-hydrolysing UDP-N-acetyl-D-glucosamine 2-epimerase
MCQTLITLCKQQNSLLKYMAGQPDMAKDNRKICVMTGTRAEYGLMYWLMRELQADPAVALQLVVSAMHLAPEFGSSVNLIRHDGFTIDAEIPCLADGDDYRALGESMGQAHLGFVEAFSRLAPDVIVLLGDRFETLSAATAATALRIPIAHLHGGETSEGAMDEYFRHAITKLAQLHFVAAAPYARRVIQMGEQPDRVFTVGALGLENFVRLDLPNLSSLSSEIGFDLSEPYLLLTYHPATLDERSPLEAFDEVLAALEAMPSLKILATKANADPGGRTINARLEAFVRASPERRHLVDSLGQARYLGAMRGAAAVVGNSSSGIIEAPAIDVPTVNIGSRQDGRLKAASVTDCPDVRDAIAAAIRQTLDPSFRASIAAQVPPYGRPRRIAGAIVGVLRSIELGPLRKKTFHDFDAGQLS